MTTRIDDTPHPICAGCEAEIIAVTGGHWRITVSTPFGATLPRQTFCLACMATLAARGVKLHPPMRRGGLHDAPSPAALHFVELMAHGDLIKLEDLDGTPHAADDETNHHTKE